MPPDVASKCKLEIVIIRKGRKGRNLEERPAEQGGNQQQTQPSRNFESRFNTNPRRIGGGRALIPLHQYYSFAYMPHSSRVINKFSVGNSQNLNCDLKTDCVDLSLIAVSWLLCQQYYSGCQRPFSRAPTRANFRVSHFSHFLSVVANAACWSASGWSCPSWADGCSAKERERNLWFPLGYNSIRR